ncbi:MAG: DUF4440 domain-containing protein [Gammaproteobacteria bacterium]|nr:DUF4440 domain-containing protein [Gammaproteobacteria bacterium]
MTGNQGSARWGGTMLRGGLALLILGLLLGAGPLRAEEPEAAALDVLDAFMEAFNARDMEAWEDSYHFPHFRMADGELSVLERAGLRSPELFDRLAATGWDHSAWLTREAVQTGPGKVHLAVTFARYRADGSELARYQSLYVVTREDGRWGIRGRSSFAP